jgi:hypothetical protein
MSKYIKLDQDWILNREKVLEVTFYQCEGTFVSGWDRKTHPRIYYCLRIKYAHIKQHKSGYISGSITISVYYRMRVVMMEDLNKLKDCPNAVVSDTIVID